MSAVACVKKAELHHVFWKRNLKQKWLQQQEILGATDDTGSGHGVGGPSAFSTWMTIHQHSADRVTLIVSMFLYSMCNNGVLRNNGE